MGDVVESSSLQALPRKLASQTVYVESNPYQVGAGLLPQFIVSCIFAFIYKGSVVEKLPALTTKAPSNKFSNGLFSCFGDVNQCLYHWCCSFTAAAKNMQVAGVMDFWPGF